MDTLIKKHNSIISIIAHCIENDENGIKNLLAKNGINTDFITTKSQLTEVFLQALSKSNPLIKDFDKYVKSKYISPSYSNSTGREQITTLDLSDLSRGGTITGNITSSLPDKLPSNPGFNTNSFNQALNQNIKKDGFFSGFKFKDLLNTGIQALELQKDIQTSKDNRIAVEQAVQIKRDEINLNPKTSKNTTGIYIGLGILGIIVIIGVNYYIRKKKK